MAKGEIACFEQFLLLSQYFQSCLLQMLQNTSIAGNSLEQMLPNRAGKFISMTLNLEKGHSLHVMVGWVKCVS